VGSDADGSPGSVCRMSTPAVAPPFTLAGKVVVVTGASSGIGEATALRLAEAGATVIAVARRADRLQALSARHTGIHPHVADVVDTDAIDELAAVVRRDHGACHVLVNNAGVGGSPFEDRDDLDDALRTIDINLLGTMRCIASFAELLAESAPSRVVNVASVAGKVGIGPAAYAASKFGMVGLSEALSLSWADRGVIVSQLNPGFIATEGFPQTQILRSPMKPLVGKPADVAKAIEGLILSGRTERTVPRWYRVLVVLRHIAPGAFRRAAGRSPRAGGRRD
jgi:NAD(P)-dependent dehydrogenase (short-subunit alcohol dehydrogenase family)